MSTRNTVRKKMSLRDYINLINYFETGERDMDLSEYDQNILSRVETRVMRFTPEEKKKMDEFFAARPFAQSARAILDTVPKNKQAAQEPKLFVQNKVAPEPKQMPKPAIEPVIEEVVADEQEPTGQPAGQFDPDVIMSHPWIVDPSDNFEARNFDIGIAARMIETGQISGEDFKAIFMIDDPSVRLILAEPIGNFACSIELNERYINVPGMQLVTLIDMADKVYKKYVDIINEPPISQEKQVERYKKYLLDRSAIPVKVDSVYNYDVESTPDFTVQSVEDNKILIGYGDNEESNVLEYEDVKDMENDVLYLASLGHIDHDEKINLFGKNTSVNKIVSKTFKKHPKGLPGAQKFYHSSREALEDGAITL